VFEVGPKVAKVSKSSLKKQISEKSQLWFSWVFATHLKVGDKNIIYRTKEILEQYSNQDQQQI
jgi:hypothetical protein